MYKVILVDDEKWSLEGLMNVFPWEEMGFDVIAQLTNSQDALEIIRDQTPDVVFTDIRMPNISGLDLISFTREMGKTSEFIIISGYDDFNYAQQALQLGAFDYRLKPIDPDDARMVLKRLKDHLDEAYITDNIMFFEDLANSINSPYELLKNKGFVFTDGMWQVITIRSQHPIEPKYISSMLNNINHLSIWIGLDKIVIICCDCRNVLEHLMSSILICVAMKFNWYIGMSRLSISIDKMSWLLRESDIASCQHFIYSKPGLISFNSENFMIISSIINQIEGWVSKGNKQEILQQIHDLPNILIESNMNMFHAEALWNRFITLIRDCMSNVSVDLELDYLDYSELAYRFKNIHEMCEYIKKVFMIHFEIPKDYINTNVNDNFLELLSEVRQNYMDRIFLGDLAHKYFLNLSYCSELFKKVTGLKFMDYITNLRMNKAKELLRTGEYTSQHISEMVGYNDYYYFSKKFKKIHGVSPSLFNQSQK